MFSTSCDVYTEPTSRIMPRLGYKLNIAWTKPFFSEITVTCSMHSAASLVKVRIWLLPKWRQVFLFCPARNPALLHLPVHRWPIYFTLSANTQMKHILRSEKEKYGVIWPLLFSWVLYYFLLSDGLLHTLSNACLLELFPSFVHLHITTVSSFLL